MFERWRKANLDFVKELLPEGNVPQMYHVDAFDAPKHLPFTITQGDVVITVDVTGPFDRGRIPPQYMTPNDIRDMADYISTACTYTYLGGMASYGGFVIRGLDRLKAQVLDTGAEIDKYPYPVSTAFLVLSITQRLAGKPQPGATDPAIPTVIQTWENAEIVPGMSAALREEYMRRAEVFVRAAGPMSVGSSRKWWDGFEGAAAPVLTANQTTNISLNQAGEVTRNSEDSVDVA